MKLNIQQTPYRNISEVFNAYKETVKQAVSKVTANKSGLLDDLYDYVCEDCGAELLIERETQDIDGNHPTYRLVCPNCDL